MKFLLINPWIYDSSAYDFWLKPLGLLYIGEILKNHGHKVTFIDLLDRYDEEMLSIQKSKEKRYGTGKFYSVEVKKPETLKNIPRKFKRYGLPKELFIKKLKRLKSIDAILTSTTMTYWYYGTLKTIETIRDVYPDKPIFLGGICTTLLTNHAKKIFETYKVKIVPGTGLLPLKKVLKNFNLGLKDFNWFEETDLNYNCYSSKLPYVVLLSSLGCTFNCSYCVTPRIWKYRYRNTRKIEHNIFKILKEKPNIKDIIFFDDAFLLRKDLEEFLKMLAKYKVRYHLPNGIHARLVDYKTASLLSKANFKTIRLGYETSDPSLQKETGNKVNNNDLQDSVYNLLKAGIDAKEIAAYIIINLPGQKASDVYKAIDFCNSLGIKVNLNEFTPIPSTPDYEKLIKQGYIKNNIDPLLLNNAYLPYWWQYSIDIEEIHKIKQYANEANNSI